MTLVTRPYGAASLDTRRTNPAWAMVDVSDCPLDVPAYIASALCRLSYTELYPVGDSAWQVECYGRAGKLQRDLEALGFVVTDAVDDRMNGQAYCYAMFKMKGE